MGKTKTSAPGRRHATGFTLVEMLVVLAILVGLTAAFPLAWQRLSPQRQVQVYARRMAADLRMLRADAMRSNTVTDLNTTDTHGYRLEPTGAFRQLPDAIGVRQLPKAGVPPLQQAIVYFYPDGSSSGGEFILERGGRQAKLAISPMSGRVVLE